LLHPFMVTLSGHVQTAMFLSLTSLLAAAHKHFLTFVARYKCSSHCFKKCRMFTKRWDWARAINSGGMPSSHTALITSTALAIGLREGVGSSAFALSVALAVIIAYDATGVRRQAGKHAAVLNALLSELPAYHPANLLLSPAEQLKVRLGHEPNEVLWGALLGSCVAALTHVILM
jgi:hypothetical protein